MNQRAVEIKITGAFLLLILLAGIVFGGKDDILLTCRKASFLILR